MPTDDRCIKSRIGTLSSETASLEHERHHSDVKICLVTRHYGIYSTRIRPSRLCPEVEVWRLIKGLGVDYLRSDWQILRFGFVNLELMAKFGDAASVM